MKYSFSSETDIAASVKLSEIEFRVVDYLQPALNSKSLKNIDIEVCYIPIVMGKDSVEDYPERSEIMFKESLFYCCPQISHEIIVAADFNNRLKEYLRGLISETPEAMLKLGATNQQIRDFDSIIKECFLELKE